MAFVCDTIDLCVAVAKSGGVGALAGSLLPPPVLKERLKAIKAATDGPFHVNFLTLFPPRVSEIPKDRSEMPSIGKTIFAGQEKEVKPFDSLVVVPETTGSLDQMRLLAGQGVGLIRSIEPAADIIAELIAM